MSKAGQDILHSLRNLRDLLREGGFPEGSKSFAMIETDWGRMRWLATGTKAQRRKASAAARRWDRERHAQYKRHVALEGPR
jgi:hypothetical protein